jgi:hypothetical protein
MSKDSSEVAFLTWLGALFLPAGVVGVSFASPFRCLPLNVLIYLILKP